MGLSCFKSWKLDSRGHKKGNRDVLASPGSYFFLSNSAGQGDEWLKSLNKGVWIPFTGVFGQRLEETVLYERRYGLCLVPLVVEQCVTFIRERGLSEVGLFRQPGRTSLVKELQEAFDSGERPTFDGSTDVHTVASLLKLYLRQLPEPLVPYSSYQDFLLCGRKLSSDRTLGLGELRNLLQELPVANFNLLKFICQFLNEVQSYSNTNRMSVQNLATVFGPNILRAKAEDPQSIVGGAALVQVLMLELIREHESLFAKVSPAIFDHPLGGLNASSSPLQWPRLQPSSCPRQLSLPIISDGSKEPQTNEDDSSILSVVQSNLSYSQKRHFGHRYTSSHPENCLFPSPSSSRTARHHSDRLDVECYQRPAACGECPADAPASGVSVQPRNQRPDESTSPTLSGWSKVWPVQNEEASCFWGGADEQNAVQRTVSAGSSGTQEDSTLSAYDNLKGATPHQKRKKAKNASGQDSGSNPQEGLMASSEVEVVQADVGPTRRSSSSWSSCEVLPLDEIDQDSLVTELDILPKTAQKRVVHEGESKDDGQDRVTHQNSPASCSVVSDSTLSTGSSEVFLPSGPPDPQGSDTQTEPKDAGLLIAELRQQMTQQRTEYQSKIERQVAVLRLSLEQQRRSQNVTETKIRNMEKVKADADQRNSALQREMESFFRMYGQIRRREEDQGRKGRGSI
ncbi:unnamed protein product [Menidia menidia]|uniref:(Atlantic silverside) hypothetical protein n=1 Tax=Menidia menidia TaxID=238744 RepID=A0A8S4AQD9_9TELE|nr:unnamed protein product [Menidia menidia]